MGLFSGIIGNVSEIDPEKFEKKFSEILVDTELVEKAYHLIRDMIVLTNKRIILIDIQGATGIKKQILSIPYSNIVRFAKESAGIFDLDAEIKLWVKDEQEPIIIEVSRGTDSNEFYRTLGRHILK